MFEEQRKKKEKEKKNIWKNATTRIESQQLSRIVEKESYRDIRFIRIKS